MQQEENTAIGDATLTASGIASLAGVGRAAVSNWRRRYGDFPTPVGGTPASPTFSARAVEKWLREQGKLHQAGTEQWAWRHIESYQPAAQIGDALGIAGAYLLAHATKPALGLLTPKQLTTRLRSIDRGLAATVDELLPAQWTPQLTTILNTIHLLAQEQDPETAFEFLHTKYVTSAQSMSGLASTPDAVAEAMLALTGEGTVTFDFTCGTGSILRMAADRAVRTGTAITCLAQEIKPQYALIAHLRLQFVHRRAIEAGRNTPPPVLHVGDSLLNDAYPDLRADVIAANFPFGIHDWGHDRLAYDPRWVYGLPPRTEPELAWIQHALAHLAPGGTAAALMPPAAALRPAGRRIRAELIRRGVLRAVVALKPGLMPPAGVGLHIWALTQPHADEPPADRILFIDASGTERPLDLVTAAWHQHRSGEPAEAAGVYRSVPAIDILHDHVDLTPQRYLPPASGPGGDPDHTIAAITNLQRLLDQVRHALPAVRPATTASVRSTPQVSLGDLVRSGTMAILRRVELQAGDILIPTVGHPSIPRVATGQQAGTELSPDMQVLRIDPARFDPWFVAGFLAHNDNPRNSGRPSSSGSGTFRSDLRRLTIPVLTLQAQREYGDTFRRLAEFRTTLELAAATGAGLAHEIESGLSSGILEAAPTNRR
ncbi:N-6 DNA methylase [Dactylosporangium sp. NPDC049140]|uniref:HsdM family class I SAM-dependent methyltransferase n=1 Tax=Dactylosporangium sp. NPDC049140 TaxID=3155647 RepID=UPI0033FEC665